MPVYFEGVFPVDCLSQDQAVLIRGSVPAQDSSPLAGIYVPCKSSC